MEKIFILLVLILSSCAKEVQVEDGCECVEQIQRRANTAPQGWHNDGVRNTLTFHCDRDGEIIQEWNETEYATTTYYRIKLNCE